MLAPRLAASPVGCRGPGRRAAAAAPAIPGGALVAPRPAGRRLPQRPAAGASPCPAPLPAPASEPAIPQQPAPAQPQQPAGILPKLTSFAQTAAKALGVAALAVALCFGNVNPAHAARSAGRAGGFSAPAASSRSYGGGGMRSGLGPGYSSRGYSGGAYAPSPYMMRPPIILPSPPIVYGPGLGGVLVAPSPAVVSAGPDLVDVAIISMFLVAAASAASRTLRAGGSGGDGDAWDGVAQPTLTKVQVGLVSLARELKADLDRIAERADTSGSLGLQRMLQEVVLALLRNPAYCVYGDARQTRAGSAEALEAAFNRASLKERAKFDQETLVNVRGDGAPRRAALRGGSSGGSGSSRPDELIVVTLLVASGAPVALPARVDGLASLQSVLSALGALPADQVYGVELTWTPQADGDFYTRDEAIAEYPNLRQL